jgi:Zn-dependent peptidase ImmA (M78 family)
MNYKDIDLKKIRDEAQRITKRYYKDAIPPIISEKAIFEEGLTIGFKDLPDAKVAELDRQKSTIYLTENKKLIRQWGNFAIAHELGHWLLDDRPIDYFDPATLTDDSCDKEDKAANYFAVSLLLPDNLMEEWKWLDADVFRSAFKIPQEGVTLRKNLV